MSSRIFGVLGAFLVAAILFYLSRYWFLDLWSREGLFGIEWLSPRGGLVRDWLRAIDFGDVLKGRDLIPFELLIWAIGGFLLLTAIQSIVNRFNR